MSATTGPRLAKTAIDVGMMTNQWPAYRQAFTDLDIPYDHVLKIGGGVHQHRYAVGDTVVKVNSHRTALPAVPVTLAGVRLAGVRRHGDRWVSPEGVTFDIVRPGTDGIVDVEVTWKTADRRGVGSFLEHGLGASVDGDRWRVGTSWIVVEPDPAASSEADLDGAGFRYLTVQVHDVVREHRRMLDLGFAGGLDPVRLGDTACISFVRAPDGTWVEISQRASLTGPLPDLANGP